MKEILLKKGKIAFVDDEDYERVNSEEWNSLRGHSGIIYARNNKSHKGIPRYMHRFIMNAKEGTQIDHINGNGLDNRLVYGKRSKRIPLKNGESLCHLHYKMKLDSIEQKHEINTWQDQMQAIGH